MMKTDLSKCLKSIHHHLTSLWRSCGFCSERFPLPLGAWDGLRYFIVALPEPAI